MTRPTDDDYRDAAVLMPATIIEHDAEVRRDDTDGAYVAVMIRTYGGDYVDVLVKVFDTSAGDATGEPDHG